MSQRTSSVLFIVHPEEMFRKKMPAQWTEEFFTLMDEAEIGFDRIISLISGIETFESIEEVQLYQTEQWEWGWGYNPIEDPEDDLDKEENKWIIPAPLSLHEWTAIPHELRKQQKVGELQNANVWVIGGFDNECLSDWEAVLEHLNIQYKRIKSLCY